MLLLFNIEYRLSTGWALKAECSGHRPFLPLFIVGRGWGIWHHHNIHNPPNSTIMRSTSYANALRYFQKTLRLQNLAMKQKWRSLEDNRISKPVESGSIHAKPGIEHASVSVARAPWAQYIYIIKRGNWALDHFGFLVRTMSRGLRYDDMCVAEGVLRGGSSFSEAQHPWSVAVASPEQELSHAKPTLNAWPQRNLP